MMGDTATKNSETKEAHALYVDPQHQRVNRVPR
jgi:hypothetical protein